MATVFLICALAGGVVMLCQFALSMVGLGGGHDIQIEHHIDFGGHHDGALHTDQGSTWFFHVLSFRALVAALTFFGLGGLAASSSTASAPFSLPIAFSAGATAMVLVGWLMGMLNTLQSEGNVHIEGTVGAMGTVYLTIPAKNGGAGKVTVKVQNRTMEYAAVTEENEALKTGAPIMVIGVVAPDMVQVAAAND